MSEYTEPTQSDFDNAEQVQIDVLTARDTETMTKSGSVIRELLIRPFAYIFSWAVSNLKQQRTESSVAYLKNSQLTENEVADEVASNYFVQRNPGVYAHGTIRLRITPEVDELTLALGTVFYAGSIALQLIKRTVLTTSPEAETDDELQVQLYYDPIQNNYYADIPVRASEYGFIEIPSGVAVSTSFSSSTIISAQIHSAITGGGGQETDAELMLRCQYNTADAGIGSYNGIRRKLNNAPVHVYSFNVLAGEDAALLRQRWNNLSVNPGGVLDVYVKTQVQASITKLTDLEPTNDVVTIENMPAYRVVGVTYVDPDTLIETPVAGYDVRYEAAAAQLQGDSQRLSVYQNIVITLEGTYEAVNVQLSTMSGIDDLQAYMDGADQRFVGQDVLVKQAIPAAVTLECGVQCVDELTDDEIALLKDTIAGTVNAMGVGDAVLNFSNLRSACQQQLPKAQLMLPCSMHVEIVDKGGRVYSYTDMTGVLDMSHPVSESQWDPAVCFFSITTEAISIKQI